MQTIAKNCQKIAKNKKNELTIRRVSPGRPQIVRREVPVSVHHVIVQARPPRG